MQGLQSMQFKCVNQKQTKECETSSEKLQCARVTSEVDQRECPTPSKDDTAFDNNERWRDAPCGSDGGRTEASPSDTPNFRRKSEQGYRCTVCGVSFSDLSSMKQHRCTHTVTRSYSCGVCGAAFITKYELGNHLRFVHIIAGPFWSIQGPGN